MKKQARRQIKKAGRQIRKATKTVRKALKRAGGPAGIATGALTLGGLAAAAAAAASPTVRTRTRELASSARDFFARFASEEHVAHDQPRLEHTH